VLILIALLLEFSGVEPETLVSHVYQLNVYMPMLIFMMISSERLQRLQIILELTIRT
jgi:hypothetical protein